MGALIKLWSLAEKQYKVYVEFDVNDDNHTGFSYEMGILDAYMLAISEIDESSPKLTMFKIMSTLKADYDRSNPKL